jgi:hypothetical protein
MKKALSFAVALGLVAGMASSAMAEDTLSMTGDARIQGWYKNNTLEANDDLDDTYRAMDQRYRLNFAFNVSDDVKVHVRLVVENGPFGGADLLTGMDRAHMNINMLGGTWIIGQQNASWGNKFFGWNGTVDRIKAIYKAGDLTYGGYLQKSKEGNYANGDGDIDTYAAFAIGKAGDTKYGVLLNYDYDDTGLVPASLGESVNGYKVDVFLNAKAGPADIMAELYYQGGDLNENLAGDAILGGFVGASMSVNDQMSAKAMVAYWDGNQGLAGKRDCDNDFAPTLLIGECTPTAILDFGETTNSSDDSTYLITAGIDMKMGDKMTLGAGLGYLMASEESGVSGTEDQTMIEVDLSLKYALAQNATYSLGIAYGSVDEWSLGGATSGGDDAIFVVGHKIDVKW